MGCYLLLFFYGELVFLSGWETDYAKRWHPVLDFFS